MALRVILEALRRRWRAKLAGLLTVAFGIAVLGALLHVVTQGEDRLALDLRGYGPNLVVRAASEGALLREDDARTIKTIFWRNNVTALAPELSAMVDVVGSHASATSAASRFAPAGGAPRFSLIGTWLDHAMPLDGVPHWRTGLMHLQPSWRTEGAVDGALPREDADPPEMLAGARLAAARGWKIGDVVDVARGDRSERLAVSGILHAGDEWDDRAIASLAPVQRLLGREDGAAEILVGVLAKPDDDLSRRTPQSLSDRDKERMTCSPYLGTVARQIEQAVAGSKAEPIRRVSEAESAYRSRLQALLALLGISAAALTCLGVYGSVRSALAERRAEMGLLQALGARRATIAGLFLGEGLAIGLVGALIGSALGFALAASLSRVVFGEPLSFSMVTLPVLIVVGLLLSGVGSALAVRQALRMDTLALLGSAT